MLMKIYRSIRQFLKTNGLQYTLIAALLIITIASLSYSHFEKANFWNSVWWSLVTTTTVGYGDISPQTIQGKITAVVLMLLGIGLISSITSTTSAFFQNKVKDDLNPGNSNNEEVVLLHKKIERLEQKIDNITDLLK